MRESKNKQGSSNEQRPDDINSSTRKLASTTRATQSKFVDESHIQNMIDSAKRTSTLQVSLFMVICYSKFCCGRNSKYRLLNKANNRYEDILDIRSFAKVHINLSLLISLLLTK